MKKQLFGLLTAVLFANSAHAAATYEIEAAVNDEKFLIDGELYEAKIYCMGWGEGEDVIFIEGTAGLCTSAELYNVTRQETCSVWCE
jgi:hypothetical protein